MAGKYQPVQLPQLFQAELARENESLVAEMVKADRVANSITDQMYSECQVTG